MIALWILLFILLLLIGAFLFCIAPRRPRDTETFKQTLFAHRGLHTKGNELPENSLAAFRAAAEQGYMIENDIHLTADGEVVVFHDSSLKRMCGVAGRIEQMTLAELKKCCLQGTEEQIPTLQECLDTVDGRVPLLIEF